MHCTMDECVIMSQDQQTREDARGLPCSCVSPLHTAVAARQGHGGCQALDGQPAGLCAPPSPAGLDVKVDGFSHKLPLLC